MFFPSSQFKRIWDMMIVVLVVFNCVYLPLDIAFNIKDEFMSNVDMFVDLLFICDILINFRTTFQDQDTGEYETNAQKIAMKYINGWFWLDLPASLPFELIFLLSGVTDVYELTWLQLLKAPRLLRIGRLMKFLEHFVFANVWRIVRLLLMFMLAAHWVGCFLYFICETEPLGTSWTFDFGMHSSQDPYLVDAYAKVVITGLGFLLGTITELNSWVEHTYAILILIAGAGMYVTYRISYMK